MRGHGAKDIGQQDLLRSRLDMQLDMNHKLVRLSRLIDWESLDAEISQMFPARSGRPATRTRLIAGLMYLQHSGGFSDVSPTLRMRISFTRSLRWWRRVRGSLVLSCDRPMRRLAKYC